MAGSDPATSGNRKEPAGCRHGKTQVIAKDEDAEYVECLECGAILEAGELPEPSGFNESLSDA